QAPEQAPRLEHAGRRVDADVGDVLPRERAAQLARADRVIRDAGLRRAARLEAGAAADPLAGDAARAERSGDGEPGRGVAARAAACDDDHLYFASERLRRAPALDGRAIIARGPCRAPALDGRAIIARGLAGPRRSTVGRSSRVARSRARGQPVCLVSRWRSRASA